MKGWCQKLPVVVNGKRYESELSFKPFEPVVYETVRTYCRKLFMLQEHFRRLLNSAKLVGIEKVPDIENLKGLLEGLMEEIDGEVYYKIYLRPSGDIFVEYQKAPEDLVLADLEFSEYRKSGIIPQQLKIVGRTDVLMARIYKKTYEVLMLNPEGFLAEGSFSNVFLVKGQSIVTPSLDTGILSGITREIVIGISKRVGLEVVERKVLPWEIFESKEIFITHTSRGIVPVRKVESFEFKAPGEITEKLLEAFRSFVMEGC